MAEYLWDFPVARETFVEAGEALGWDIGELCRHGSMEELTRTDRTQLTILTCSVAVWRILEEKGASLHRGGRTLSWRVLGPRGHRPPELSPTLCGWWTCAAGPCRPAPTEKGGTMAAIIGLEDVVVEEVCASLPEVWPANYNSPGQMVISGSADSVLAAGELALTRGETGAAAAGLRGFPHPVHVRRGGVAVPGIGRGGVRCRRRVGWRAGPRHSDAGAGRFFSTTEVRYPEPGELADVLARQLMSPVRFAQSMETVLQGADGRRPGWRSVRATCCPA